MRGTEYIVTEAELDKAIVDALADVFKFSDYGKAISGLLHGKLIEAMGEMLKDCKKITPNVLETMLP